LSKPRLKIKANGTGRHGTGDPRHDVLARLEGVKPQPGGGWTALCPAHEDRRASLSVGVGDGGKILLRCHAGCKVEAVVAALGLTMTDLYPDDQPAPASRRIAATYDYTDESGELLYQAVRYVPKDFRQRRPDGKGGWTWSLKGVRRVLYRLPDVVAAPADQAVFVVEGEKDADRLAEENMLATTCAMGAGKWRPEYNEALAGRRVVVLPDNDEAGRAHAAQVSQSLLGTAASVKVVELPGLPPRGDVTDWLENGGTASRLWELIEATQALEAGKPPAPQADHATADVSGSGYDIILDYFRRHYEPTFRRGMVAYSARLGREVKPGEATWASPRALIEELEKATDAPADKNGVKRHALPQFFATWSRVAWTDLLNELPEEDKSEVVDAVAEEEFRLRVNAALSQLVTLGEVVRSNGREVQQHVERLSVVGWCARFARSGPWKSIRSYHVWTRVAEDAGGQPRVQVALRVELFAQLNARELAGITPTKFARLCAAYGVGHSLETERPQGQRAVLLDDAFLHDLLPGREEGKAT
jgi:hypothetical protein